MKHIAIVYGTRPQVIKLAPLVKELDKHKDNLTYSLINTGQHYDENMDGVFHKQLGIGEPDINFGSYFGEVKMPKGVLMVDVNNIPDEITLEEFIQEYRQNGNIVYDGKKDVRMIPIEAPNENHAARLGVLVAQLGELLKYSSPVPNLVVVIGDTDSTLAGALAANKMGIPVAHIEAGVRSGNRSQPEEINRILVDEMSSLHFIPDNRCYEEIISNGRSYITGQNLVKCTSHTNKCDLMLDAFLMYKGKAKPSDVKWLKDTPFNLLTLHRANLTWDFVLEVIRAVEFIGIPTIWPIHPRVCKMEPPGYEFPDNIVGIPPQGYFEMLWLVQNCDMVLTDSGGLVREAAFAEKPCITLRTESEWEGHLIRDYSALAILNAINHCLEPHPGARNIRYGVNWKESHGNGKASETIVKAIHEYLEIDYEHTTKENPQDSPELPG